MGALASLSREASARDVGVGRKLPSCKIMQCGVGPFETERILMFVQCTKMHLNCRQLQAKKTVVTSRQDHVGDLGKVVSHGVRLALGVAHLGGPGWR